MRVRNNRITTSPKLMIIPMIDVIFFLLVFFMFSTLQMVYQKTLPVNLPCAAHAQQETPKPIAVCILADGSVSIGDKNVAVTELRAKVGALVDRADTPVILRADTKTEHGKVIAVMDELKAAGVRRLAVATQEAR